MTSPEKKQRQGGTGFWIGFSTVAIGGIFVFGEPALALNCREACADASYGNWIEPDQNTCSTLAERGFPLHSHPEDFNTDSPTTTVRVFASGSAAGTAPLGRFRWVTFYRTMLRANGATTQVAMLDACADTAYEIARRYPDLEDWERLHQYNCLRYEIELTKARSRGCKDYSAALPIIARALRLPDNLSF
jgi:hypothetical protein